MSSYATNADLLLASGRDAMSNLYDVFVLPPDGLSSAASALGTTSVMVTRARDFTPPELQAETYQNHYKMDYIDVPAPKIQGDKTFEIGYRIDAAYALHNALRKWKYASTLNPTVTDVDNVGGMTYNGIWGYKGDEVFGRVAVVAHKYSDLLQDAISNTSDADAIYGIASGIISAAGSAGDNFIGWTFNNVWVQSVSEPQYTRDSSNPLEGTASFRFITMGLIGPNVAGIDNLIKNLGSDVSIGTPDV